MSDISTVNFNKYFTRENLYLPSIKEIFSDNINVFIPLELSNVVKRGRKLSWNNNFNRKCRAIINDIFGKAKLDVHQNISGIAVIPYKCTDQVKMDLKLQRMKIKKFLIIKIIS